MTSRNMCPKCHLCTIRWYLYIFYPKGCFFLSRKFGSFFIAFNKFISIGTSLFKNVNVNVSFNITNSYKLPILFPINSPNITFKRFRTTNHFFTFHIPQSDYFVPSTSNILIFFRMSSQTPNLSIIMSF